MSILLKHAAVYDGTGRPARRVDVCIDGDMIQRVAPEIVPKPGDTIYDLSGLSLAPGFIDAHSHNDWFALRNDAIPYFDPFVRQGITTYVTGNCGLSATGFDESTPHKALMGGGLFGFEDTVAQPGSIAGFAKAMDGKIPGNIALLAGHCTARAAVSGNANRPLTPDEESAMLAQLEKALQEGAAGLSLGLMYEPGLYAQKKELKKVAALCAKYNRPLTVHPRANSAVSMAYPQLLGRSHLLRAFDELMDIAHDTRCKLHYSHAIFVGRRSLKDKAELLTMISRMRRDNIDVMFDIYNETMGVSVITVILPVWYQALSPKARRSPLNRLKLTALIHATSALLGFGFQDIQVAYIGPGYEKYEGKSVHQIAQEEGLSDLNAYLMLCEKSNFKGRVNMGPYTTQEIIHEFERDDRCLYMTDAWVEPHGVQNPAIYDCFPKFLRDSLLGKGDTLPNTIRRMTGATADRFALKNRGYIRPGCFADLTVFDENEIKSATPDQEKSFGIRKVFINGKLVLDDGKLDTDTLRTSGRVVTVE